MHDYGIFENENDAKRTKFGQLFVYNFGLLIQFHRDHATDGNHYFMDLYVVTDIKTEQ